MQSQNNTHCGSSDKASDCKLQDREFNPQQSFDWWLNCFDKCDKFKRVN